MLEKNEKIELKNIVLKALEEFSDLKIDIKNPNAREAIAVRIASDIISASSEDPVPTSVAVLKK